MSDDKWEIPGYFGEEPASLDIVPDRRATGQAMPSVSMTVPWYGGEPPLKAGDVLRIEDVRQSGKCLAMTLAVISMTREIPEIAAPARETADCQTAGAVSRGRVDG